MTFPGDKASILESINVLDGWETEPIGRQAESITCSVCPDAKSFKLKIVSSTPRAEIRWVGVDGGGFGRTQWGDAGNVTFDRRDVSGSGSPWRRCAHVCAEPLLLGPPLGTINTIPVVVRLVVVAEGK